MYSKTTWKDRVVDPDTGAVVQEGTLMSAEHFNNMENGIAANDSAISTINDKVDEIDEEKISVPQTAEVGQVLTVKAVDDDGKPTEWETSTPTTVTVDSELSDTSENPVQNKVIKSEIDELKNSVSDGKSSIASAITEKGVTTASDATFDTMATNIGLIQATASGTAVASDVIKGKTFCSDAGMDVTGTMESYTDDEVKIDEPGEESFEVETFDRFVCVGGGGLTNYSTDGETWSDKSYIYNYSFNLGVTYGNDRFVCVGTKGSSNYSADGISWTAMSGLNTSYDYNGVTYGNDRFVCVGGSGLSYYSTNGTSWTAMSGLYNSAIFRSVTYGNDRFVCVGDIGLSYYSTNGTSWTAMSKAYSTKYYGVTYGNDRFVCVGTAGISYYSADGISWTAMTGLDTSGTSDYKSVTYGNDRFVCVGVDGLSSYSTDGETWTAMTGLDTSKKYYGVTYGNDRFVCVGDDGSSYYSTNGISWTAMSGLTKYYYQSVTSHTNISTTNYLTYTIQEGYHSAQKIMLKTS